MLVVHEMRRLPTRAAMSAALMLGCAPPAETDRPPETAEIGAPTTAEAANRLAAIRARFRGPLGSSVVPPAVAERFEGDHDRLVAHLPGRTPGAPGAALTILPRRAFGWARVVDERSGLAVSFALDGARDVEVTIADGLAIYAEGGPSGASLLHRVHHEGTEDFLVFEVQPAREQVRYLLETERVAGLRQVGDTLELLDTAGAPRLRVAPPYLVSAATARAVEARLSVHGCAADTSPAPPWRRPLVPPCTAAPAACRCEIVIDWTDGGVAYPAILDPAWTTTASLAKPRTNATAGPWPPNAGVIVVGGEGPSSGLDSVEIFDPATASWAMGPSLKAARGRHTLSVLDGGRIVVAGGISGSTTIETLEIIDPEDGEGASWVAAGSLHVARQLPATAVLPTGKLLLAGGYDGAHHAVPSAEVCDPAAKSCALVEPLNIARGGATATPLEDSSVLVVGGGLDIGSGSKTCEIFRWKSGADPASGSFVPAPPSAGVHSGHTASRLPDGSVLVVGSSAEIFHPGPGGGTWSPSSGPATFRVDHTATLLPNGDVLVVGGAPSSSETLSSAERFSFASQSWLPAGDLVEGRSGHIAALTGTTVIVAGGARGGSFQPITGGVELLRLRPDGAACSAGSDCVAGFCAGGVCCDTACDRACLSCEGLKTGGADGTCGKRLDNPCEPYRCDGSDACPTSCTTNAQCAKGFECLEAACVTEQLVCDGDHTLLGSNGGRDDCAPYACTPANDCHTFCTSQLECARGRACHTSGLCDAPLKETEASPGIGCEIAGPASPRWSALSLGGAIALLVRTWSRQRRRRPPARPRARATPQPPKEGSSC